MTHPPLVPADPGRVDLLSPQEVRYWCAQFGCSEGQLRDAVAKVGDHAAAVRATLKPPPP